VAVGKEVVGREGLDQHRPGSKTKKPKKGSIELRKIVTIATTIMLILALSASAAMAATLVGNPWAETLTGTAESDTISGKEGGDALIGKGGNDFLYGNRGHDGLYGGPGDDEIHGGTGDDRAEERSVHGGEGADILYGGAGGDALYAGPDDDTLHSVGDQDGDLVDCGSGTDSVQKGSDQNLDRFVNCERFVN
jgi:Ca2+-binding RTX toxin-like protein